MIALRPVTIVGGGLAGLSLGIALRKAGVPAEILEAGAYPRHRVCGEFVAGLDEGTIDKLGIGVAFRAVRRHRNVTWYLRGEELRRQTLPEGARAISRHLLDARLAEIFVAAGGRLSTHTRAGAVQHREGVVLANGRRPATSSPWLGLKIHARDFATRDELELHLGDGAYVGLSAVEDGWVNVCGLFRRRPGLKVDRDGALRAHLVASGLEGLADMLATAQVRPGSQCGVAGFAFVRTIQADENLRLGDACAMVPPFTGNGMTMAFLSAALALDPLVAWSAGRQAWGTTVRSIQAALNKRFRVRLAAASFLHPFLFYRGLQPCLRAAAQARLLPLTFLYRLLH